MAGAGQSKRYIFGLKIYCDDYDKSAVLTPDAYLGLYNVTSANSQFRWMYGETSNTTDEWKTGVFTKGGLRGFGVGYDGRRSGNIANISNADVEVFNSIDGTEKLWKRLQDILFSFNGLYCELVEIDDLIAHGGTNANETVIYRGICGEISEWDELSSRLPIKNSYYKRKVNLSTKIAAGGFPNADEDIIGKEVPVTFGGHSKAKFVRTANKISIFTILSKSNMVFHGDTNCNFITNLDYATPIFPVVGKDTLTPPEMYKIQIGLNSVWADVDGNPLPSVIDFTTEFSGDVLHVVGGDGEGSYRKILKVEMRPAAPDILEITLEQVFETTLAITGASQSTIQIENISREFMPDTWKCKGYLNTAGVLLTGKETHLYSYDDDKSVKVPALNTKTPVTEQPSNYIKLPEFSYSDSGDGNKNKLIIDIQYFDRSIESVSSFLILPLKSVSLYSKADLFEIYGNHGNVKITDGFFKTFPPLGAGGGSIISGSVNDIIDRDHTTSFKTNVINGTEFVMNLLFPDFPEDFSFDDVYLLLNMKIIPDTMPGGFSLVLNIYPRRFWGIGTSLLAQNLSGYSAQTINYDTTPEFYYLSAPAANKEKNFYYVKNNVWVPTNVYNTGYALIPITGVDTKEKYMSLLSTPAAFGLEHFISPLPPSDKNVSVEIFEMAVMFKKDVSIKKEVYSPFAGRVFNDSWATRLGKTSTDLMMNPVEYAEHIFRLQNWSDVGDLNVDYGKQYSPNALINTGSSSEGQIDHALLNTIRMKVCRNQILKYDDADSGKLLESICKEFFLCNFQNREGKESLNVVGKINSTPAISINLTDIIKGSLSQIQMQTPDDVYCNPFVQFDKNYATENYNKIIRITNSNRPSYSSSYVEGLAGVKAQNIWNMCHALWEYYREIYEPPSSMTELDWIYYEGHAEEYLYQWLNYMGVWNTASGIKVIPNRRVSFRVPYYIGRLWFVSMHFLLAIPFHTGGVNVQCQIEDIFYDFEKEEVEVKVVMYYITDNYSYYIQKTFDSYASSGATDWQNVISGGAGDIQRVF